MRRLGDAGYCQESHETQIDVAEAKQNLKEPKIGYNASKQHQRKKKLKKGSRELNQRD